MCSKSHRWAPQKRAGIGAHFLCASTSKHIMMCNRLVSCAVVIGTIAAVDNCSFMDEQDLMRRVVLLYLVSNYIYFFYFNKR